MNSQKPFSRKDYLNTSDPLQMTVDVAALRWNFSQLESMVGEATKIIPSIKGDGYGVGASLAAQVFKECGAYAVATGSIHDAIAIRDAGNDIPIHLFPGILPGAMPLVRELGLMPTIYSKELALAASEASHGRLKVFVKVDAGFGRLGVPVEQARDLIDYVASLPGLQIEAVFTHVPFSDGPGLEWAKFGLAKFDRLLGELKDAGYQIPISQSLASSGVLKDVPTHTNAVCVGHLLYGGLGKSSVDAEKTARFRPAISEVSASIVHIRKHGSQASIGNGGRLQVEASTVVGIVPIGLHEGYRSAAAGQTAYVLHKGRRLPLMFVSQEYAAVDLSRGDSPAVGDTIVIYGRSGDEQITIEDLAGWQGQSPLHVVMNMCGRVRKNYSLGN
ncbi:alanine racemase [Pseudomonas sp. NPDC090592]|uniref:alanine racemase n=1 Tax=Pseudomonas sp. NPDC090592 TaxID=3364480 RepID=UPI00383A6ACD